MAEEKIVAVTSKEGEGKSKITRRTEVEEIENGFLITESKEWTDPKEGWQHENKKYFSKVNPLTVKKDLKSVIKKNLPGS